MLKEFLDKIFKLPPPNMRPNIWQGWRFYITRTVPRKRVTSQNDDDYIYYQIWLCSVLLSVVLFPFFMLAFLAHVDINLGPIKFVNASTDNLKSLFEQYNDIFRQAVIWVLYPYFLVKYRWNINPRKYDVLGRIPVDNSWLFRLRMLFFGIPVVAAVAIGIQNYAYLITIGVGIRFLFAENIVSAALFYLIISWALSLSAILLVLVTMLVWRYLGPLDTSSSPDENT